VFATPGAAQCLVPRFILQFLGLSATTILLMRTEEIQGRTQENLGWTEEIRDGYEEIQGWTDEIQGCFEEVQGHS